MDNHIVHDNPYAISTDTRLATTANCLSAGTIVGISITIFLVSFSVGILLTALITYCCCVREIGESSSGQAHLSPSGSPVETLEMKDNPSYGTLASLDCCTDRF